MLARFSLFRRSSQEGSRDDVQSLASKDTKKSDDDDSTSDDAGVPSNVGTCLELKHVDEVYDHDQGEWTMREGYVPKKKKSKKNPFDKYAFIVVRQYDMYADASTPKYTTYLDIKSQSLQKALRTIMGTVRGISWNYRPLRLLPKTVLAFLPQLREHADSLRSVKDKSEDKTVTLLHLDFLLSYLKKEHASTLEDIAKLLAHDEITFELLWAILVPRTIIYTECPGTGEPRAVRLIHAERVCNCGHLYWNLETEYVEYNSQHHATGAAEGTPEFGFASTHSISIHHYTGPVKISTLSSFPMKWYPRVAELEAKLIERGRKWRSLQGVHHKYFKGTAYNTFSGKFTIDSRIMIDWKMFQQINPNYRLPNVEKTLDGREINRHLSNDDISKRIDDELEDSHLMLTSPIVYGFCLSDKLWLEFNISLVGTFEWSDEPFDNLVLPSAQKKLVKSLVEAHSKDKSGFDDFVKGKGRGLILNLFGNPGVGKSLTAEATSEHVRKPLYIVGAGELGTTANELDSNLTQIFSISSAWGAVVLIDEADVFLEERSLHDLKRNAVVAVFLRQLEYYRGILFLTTNRVRTFDEAFQSRIHVSLRYRDLAPDARRKIWVAFLKKAKGTSEIDLTEHEIVNLSTKEVNGRQIKNVVRTASALATTCEEELGHKHLIQVLEMMEQFEIDRSPHAA